jgi:hypothetical protein
MLTKQKYLIISIILVNSSIVLWACTSQNLNQPQSDEITGEARNHLQNVVPKLLDVQQLESFSVGEITKLPPFNTGADSCLTSPGPLITLSGNNTVYENKELANNTKIDASQASFTGGGENPVNIGGGTNNCWYSGKIYGGYPSDADWETTHPTAGIQIQDGSYRPVIEGVYVDRIGDGIKIRLGEKSGQSGIAEPFTVRGVWLRDIRDDCIESDWQAGALIDDSLLDGCYVLFATEKRPGASTNGSKNTWEIRDTLAFMHDQIGVYDGSSPGHGMFFKWDDTSPNWKMYNSILRVDSNHGVSSNQFNFRLDKLVDCENNILVWLGSGPFPAPVPNCFTITKDRSVWDHAVSEWKMRHGYSLSGYMFQIYIPLLNSVGIRN